MRLLMITLALCGLLTLLVNAIHQDDQPAAYQWFIAPAHDPSPSPNTTPLKRGYTLYAMDDTFHVVGQRALTVPPAWDFRGWTGDGRSILFFEDTTHTFYRYIWDNGAIHPIATEVDSATIFQTGNAGDDWVYWVERSATETVLMRLSDGMRIPISYFTALPYTVRLSDTEALLVSNLGELSVWDSTALDGRPRTLLEGQGDLNLEYRVNKPARLLYVGDYPVAYFVTWRALPIDPPLTDTPAPACTIEATAIFIAPDGTRVIFMGQGQPTDPLPLALYQTSADLCAEPIPMAPTVESLYEFEFSADSQWMVWLLGNSLYSQRLDNPADLHEWGEASGFDVAGEFIVYRIQDYACGSAHFDGSATQTWPCDSFFEADISASGAPYVVYEAQGRIFVRHLRSGETHELPYAQLRVANISLNAAAPWIELGILDRTFLTTTVYLYNVEGELLLSYPMDYRDYGVGRQTAQLSGNIPLAESTNVTDWFGGLLLGLAFLISRYQQRRTS